MTREVETMDVILSACILLIVGFIAGLAVNL